MKVILVIQNGHEEMAKNVISFFPERDIRWVYGGETRYHSVRNGLEHVQEDEVVFIHDAARPFLSSSLLQRCYDEAAKSGNAVPAITVKDSFRILSQDTNRVIHRDLLRAIQTPQTFQSSLIKQAYTLALGGTYTDDASVFEVLNQKINLVEGEEENFKITTPMDWMMAQYLISKKEV